MRQNPLDSHRRDAKLAASMWVSRGSIGSIRARAYGLIGSVLLIVLVLAAVAVAQTLDVAKVALDEGRYDDALAELKPIVQASPKDGEAHFLLGEAYFGLKQWTEAEAEYREAIDRKYKDPRATFKLAMTLIKLDRAQEASELVDKPLSKAKDPKEAALYKDIKGLAEYAQGNYSKAQEWLLGARYDDEENLEYRVNLGNAYFAGQVYPLAATEFEAVLAADSTNLDVMYKLGETYYQSRRLTEARSVFVNLLKVDSTYDDAYFRLANIYMIAAGSRPVQEARELYAAALSLYRKVREVSPDTDPVLVSKNIATVYYLLNFYDSAVVELQKAIDAGATDPELKYYLGRASMLLGQNQVAIDAFTSYRQALESDSPPHQWSKDDAELFWRTAVCMEALNDTSYLPQIAENYKRAVQLDPDNERAIGGLALAYHKLGRYAEAAVEFEKLVVKHPDESRYLFNASLPYMQLDNNEKAVEYLLRAAENDTTAEQSYKDKAYKLAAPRLIKMQRLAEAQTCYKWLINRDPNVCDNYQWYGYTLFAAKNFAAAADPLRKAYRCFESLKGKECSYNELRWWLAYSLYEAGDKDGSYKLCEKVVECDPKNTDAQDLMNRIDEEIVEEN